MIIIGQRVSFNPADFARVEPQDSLIRIDIIATVVEVNYGKRWFRVRYGNPGSELNECFNFSDLNDRVFIVSDYDDYDVSGLLEEY